LINRGFNAQPRAKENKSSVFGRFEKISGTIRLGEVDGSSIPNVFHFDIDGFARANATMITDIMSKYDRWRPVKLIAHYIPVVSKTSPGQIGMAPDFDPLDLPPDANELSVSDFYKAAAACENCTCQCVSPISEWKYVAPAADARLNSSGKLVVHATGTGVTTTIGYIQLDYTLEFAHKTPIPSASNALNVGSFTVYHNSSIVPTKIDIPVSLPSSSTETYFQGSVALAPSAIYSAIIDSTTNGYLKTVKNEAIRAGTRVFFQMATQRWDGTSILNSASTTSMLRKLALDAAFTQILTWVGDTTANGSITLGDGRWF
jgi:hypothetical protein